MATNPKFNETITVTKGEKDSGSLATVPEKGDFSIFTGEELSELFEVKTDEDEGDDGEENECEEKGEKVDKGDEKNKAKDEVEEEKKAGQVPKRVVPENEQKEMDFYHRWGFSYFSPGETIELFSSAAEGSSEDDEPFATTN